LLVGVLLVKPGDAATLAKLSSSVADARAYFDEHFPMFTAHVRDEDLERMARRRLSTLPTFAYAGGGEDALHRTTPEFHPTLGDALVEDDAWTNELGGAVLIGAFAFLFASFLLLYSSSNLGKRSRGERTVSSRARDW
jgi:hypothetical protein